MRETRFKTVVVVLMVAVVVFGLLYMRDRQAADDPYKRIAELQSENISLLVANGKYEDLLCPLQLPNVIDGQGARLVPGSRNDSGILEISWPAEAKCQGNKLMPGYLSDLTVRVVILPGDESAGVRMFQASCRHDKVRDLCFDGKIRVVIPTGLARVDRLEFTDHGRGITWSFRICPDSQGQTVLRLA